MYNNTLIKQYNTNTCSTIQYKYMYNNTLITQYNTNTCTTLH